jgi:hypothetical protein
VDQEDLDNSTRSKVRPHVEHLFGDQKNGVELLS